MERLGSMTPEELEAIEGVDPEMVERIQLAVNSYYGQFEEAVESPEEAPAEAAAEAVVAAPAEKLESENESVTIENTVNPEVP